MKYFIQHLNMAFGLLSQKSSHNTSGAEKAGLISEYMDDILVASECLARLVLNEQDQCQRNNSQIIARFYEIGETALALKLAEDFKVGLSLLKLYEV